MLTERIAIRKAIRTLASVPANTNMHRIRASLHSLTQAVNTYLNNSTTSQQDSQYQQDIQNYRALATLTAPQTVYTLLRSAGYRIYHSYTRKSKTHTDLILTAPAIRIRHPQASEYAIDLGPWVVHIPSSAKDPSTWVVYAHPDSPRFGGSAIHPNIHPSIRTICWGDNHPHIQPPDVSDDHIWIAMLHYMQLAPYLLHLRFGILPILNFPYGYIQEASAQLWGIPPDRIAVRRCSLCLRYLETSNTHCECKNFFDIVRAFPLADSSAYFA
jgi:hypothetical protein